MIEQQPLITLEIIDQINVTTVQVAWVSITSTNGHFTIGPRHEPLISLLRDHSNLVYELPDGTRGHRDNIPGGIVFVEHDMVKVILTHAEHHQLR